MKQDHGESATKEAKVVQCDVSQEGNSIKVETGELKVNLTREEDVIEAAAADDVGAQQVEEEVVWLRVATFEIKPIFH